jgi:XTP/dITP diphosphohydrolase
VNSVPITSLITTASGDANGRRRIVVLVFGVMTHLLIATRNAHKVGEIRAILGSAFEYSSLNDLSGAPEVVEDAGTFAGNATKKAVELAKWISGSTAIAAKFRPGSGEVLVLADDSGLEADALGGAPGVHSARFAALDTGEARNSSNAANNSKLLRLLKDVPRDRRTARFKCLLALAPVVPTEATGSSPVCFADEFELQTQLFEGVCDGWIGFELRGDRGFGYDPLFFPQGYDQTFGELSETVKNKLSHRARALESLRNALNAKSANQR